MSVFVRRWYVPTGAAADLDAKATSLDTEVEVTAVDDRYEGGKVRCVRIDATDMRVSIARDAGVDGGDFTLTVAAQTTAAIAWNAAAAAVKSALELLSTVGTATVSGTGSIADPWLVQIHEAPVGTAAMTANFAGLVNGSATLTVTSSLTNARTALTDAITSVGGLAVLQGYAEVTG